MTGRPTGEELLVTLVSTQRATNLTLGEDALHVVSIDTTARSWKAAILCQAPEPGHTSFPYLNVLHAAVDRTGDTVLVEIRSLRLDGKNHHGVVVLTGAVAGEHFDTARKWVESLMRKAYGEALPRKRLRVLVNPHSGPGKARALWTKQVEPIFRSAQCPVNVTFTERAGHGKELAATLDIAAHDALIVFSGDGLVHEALNGLCSRPDAQTALRQCPLGVLPAGSGNALSCSINGPKHGANLGRAALAIIKGRPMSVDVSSVTQGSGRYFSLISQTYGLMADVDLGTEHMRWMGGTRFVVGFIQRALAGPRYECEISMRIVASDKQAMREEAKAATLRKPAKEENRSGRENDQSITAEPTEQASPHPGGMPELRFGSIRDPLPASPDTTPLPYSKATGWTTINAPICTLYAGTVPYLADVLMQFPLASRDGYIDMTIVPVIGTGALLGLMDGADEGKHFDSPHQEYYKVEAYRLTPKANKSRFPNFISVDGEAVPFEPFQVEVHPGLGSVLSLHDSWYRPAAWT